MERMYAQVFHGQIQLMKDMLERGEMIYGGNRDDAGYKRFKQETMRVHYNAIDEFWTLLQSVGMAEKCDWWKDGCTLPACDLQKMQRIRKEHGF